MKRKSVQKKNLPIALLCNHVRNLKELLPAKILIVLKTLTVIQTTAQPIQEELKFALSVLLDRINAHLVTLVKLRTDMK
jgi:hypothetical protein